MSNTLDMLNARMWRFLNFEIKPGRGARGHNNRGGFMPSDFFGTGVAEGISTFSF
jgi:hypothetical protein